MEPEPDATVRASDLLELRQVEIGQAVTLVNDEDLLSHDAQAALQRIAEPMGIVLAAFFFFGALGATRQRRRGLSDFAVGLLPGGAVWSRMLRREHPLTSEQTAAVASRGARSVSAEVNVWCDPSPKDQAPSDEKAA